MASNTKMDSTSNGEISQEAKAFGAYLRNLRKAKGLNQVDLAKLIEITGGYYGFFEQGRQMPSLKIINRLAEVLDTDYLELAVRAGYDKWEALKKDFPRKGKQGDNSEDVSDPDEELPKEILDNHTEEGAVSGTQETSRVAEDVSSNQNAPQGSVTGLNSERLEWAMDVIARDPTYRLSEQFTQTNLPNSVKALVIQLYQAQTGRQLLTADESAALNHMLHG